MSERRAGNAARAVLDRAMEERELLALVRDLARVYGFAVWHDQATNARRICPHCAGPLRPPRNAPGLPDLILVHPVGRVIFAELKRETGRLTPNQRDWATVLQQCMGVEYYLWYPSSWSSGEIERVLQLAPVTAATSAADAPQEGIGQS